MTKKGSKIILIQFILIFLAGFSIGVGTLWPGIVRENGRKCFFEIIKDGSDGNVSLNTIFSISPNYLLKIKNSKNYYLKMLLIGDFCFRKF